MNFKSLRKRVGVEVVVTVLTFVLLYFFMAVLMNLNPSWILSESVTTGGDMGSHFVLAQYLRDYLLPHGKLIGWFPGWQAGLPMFQYYFVPPYLLMVFLGYFVSLEIAFKIVTLLWIFMLPLAVYFGIRAMGFERPMPEVSASFSLFLLFLETVAGGNYSQWGGNIKSTLAGQFSYGISFSFMILSIGFLYKGYHDRKHLALNAVLFALVALTHIYTTIIIGLVSTFFLFDALRSKKFDGVIYLAKVFALGFLIAGFWYIPMASKLEWSTPPKDVFYGNPSLSWVFIQEYVVFYVLAFMAVLVGFLRRDKRIFFFAYSLFIVFLFLFACKYTNFLYVRFLPFLYIVYLILAAWGVSLIAGKLEAKPAIPLMVAIIVPLLLYSTWVSDVPNWIKWNYEGLENKMAWPTLKESFDYLRDSNVQGRVDVEYEEEDYNKFFGTPRVFEVMPAFTNKSVMEGLLFESSVTFPFFFYMQKTVSEYSWWPGFPVAMPRQNMDRGLKIFKLYNIKYFLANSKKTRTLLQGNPDYRLEKSFVDSELGITLSLYRINEDSDYVEYPSKEPVLVVTDDWKPYSFKWIDTDFLDTPVVYSSSLGDYELQRFRIVVLNKSLTVVPRGDIKFFKSGQFEEALKESKIVDNSGCSTSTVLSEEELNAEVSCLNRPLWVKIPYFPNWQTAEAGKVYLSSPSLMLVFPEKNRMRLYYGMTLSDKLGWAATLLGIALVLLLLVKREKNVVKPAKVRKSSKKSVSV